MILGGHPGGDSVRGGLPLGLSLGFSQEALNGDD